MAGPIIARKVPFAFDAEPGRKCFWCACGRSARQPFCDGSHQDTPFAPVPFEVAESRTVYFCGCKASVSQPLCDGSHNAL